VKSFQIDDKAGGSPTNIMDIPFRICVDRWPCSSSLCMCSHRWCTMARVLRSV